MNGLLLRSWSRLHFESCGRPPYLRRLALPIALLGICLPVMVLAIGPGRATASPAYSSQTGKQCSYCHVTPGGPLTAEGEAFEENGQQLPPSTTETSAAPSPSEQPATSTGGPILPYPGWLWTTLIWLHIAAVAGWLAGIHLNTPRTDRLSWPGLLLLGVTGILLTLGRVADPGDLSGTRWGALLITKIVLFALLVVLATVATFVLQPRLAAGAKNEPRRSRSQANFRAQGRVTVVYRGKVYDVTGSRLWPEGRHARGHEAWQDLTGALAGAPHGPEVLQRFTLVEDAGEDRLPALMSIYTVMRYVSFVLMLAALLVVVFW